MPNGKENSMIFPKKIMRMSELKDMGFPEEYLLRAYRSIGQTFATKLNPYKQNSPIIFDTVGLNEWMQKEIRAQNKAVIRGR